MSLENAEINFKLAELLNSLSDARTELAGVQETVTDQNRTIRDLNEKLKFAGHMVFEAPCYWNVVGEERDGPYCSRCWEANNKAFHLYRGKSGFSICHECKTTVLEPAPRPQSP